MPQEIDRKTSTRRVWNPDSAASDGTPPEPSDSDVIVEVVDEISFVDPTQQYQEFRWVFDNSLDSSRETHGVTVTGSDETSKVDVERIDVYDVLDSRENYQETRISLDNASEARFAVDYVAGADDTRKTHDVKIYSKDGSAWLLIRRTDEFTIKGQADEQHWETVFSLDHKDHDAGDPPPDDLVAPTTEWDGSEINPPHRFDPFQNIVDVSWGGLAVIFYNGSA